MTRQVRRPRDRLTQKAGAPAFGQDALIQVVVPRSRTTSPKASRCRPWRVGPARDEGELVAMVGASGSGKSTRSRSCRGSMSRPRGASRRACGPRGDTPASGVDYGVRRSGFVWQQTARNLVPYLSAIENVALPLALAGTIAARATARATQPLELTGVGDGADRRPGELSGGEQQRVAIGVALANQPRWPAGRRPPASSTRATSHEVQERSRLVNRELGTTIVVVTHDRASSHMCSARLLIQDGGPCRGRAAHRHARLRHRARRRRGVRGARPCGTRCSPQEYREALELSGWVRLALEASHVSVWPDRPRVQPRSAQDDAAGESTQQEATR